MREVVVSVEWLRGDGGVGVVVVVGGVVERRWL